MGDGLGGIVDRWVWIDDGGTLGSMVRVSIGGEEGCGSGSEVSSSVKESGSHERVLARACCQGDGVV